MHERTTLPVLLISNLKYTFEPAVTLMPGGVFASYQVMLSEETHLITVIDGQGLGLGVPL